MRNLMSSYRITCMKSTKSAFSQGIFSPRLIETLLVTPLETRYNPAPFR